MDETLEYNKTEEEDENSQISEGEHEETTEKLVSNDEPRFSTTEFISKLIPLFETICSESGNFVYSDRLSDTMALPGLEILSFSSNINQNTNEEITNYGNESLQFQPMPLPIYYKEQANEIIKIAKQSPYGKGEETLMDERVRKSFELEPNQFRITNSKWNLELNEILKKVKVGLGIDQYKKVECKLHKLLLYETGGHFDYHKDSEKECKHTCTLVIQLPSIYEGGIFKVTHNGNEVELDYSQKGANGAHFISFYADCDHAVMPLTKGYRTCLVYNIIVSKDETIELPIADQFSQTLKVKEQFSPWINHSNNWRCDNQLIYLLEHEYSAESLVFGCESLKGNDYKIYSCLKEMKLPIMLIPAFFTNRYTDGYDDNDEEEEGDHFSITQMFYNNSTISQTLKMEGTKNVFPVERVSKMKLTKSSKTQTGNYGTKSTKWYKSSCLIILKEDEITNLGDKFSLMHMGVLLNSGSDDRAYAFLKKINYYLDKEVFDIWGKEVITNHDLLLMLLIKFNKKEMALEFLERSEAKHVSLSTLTGIISTFGFSDFKKSYFKLISDKTRRYSMYAMLRLFEPYYNLEDMKDVEKVFSCNCLGILDFWYFKEFCETERIGHEKYEVNKELFRPIIEQFIEKDSNTENSKYYSALSDLFMTRENANKFMKNLIANDSKKGIAKIKEYGFQTFDPELLYCNLRLQQYLELYNGRSVEDCSNHDLKQFFKGLRMFLVSNFLENAGKDLLTIFEHSFYEGEFDILSMMFKCFENELQKKNFKCFPILFSMLDECVINKFKELFTNRLQLFDDFLNLISVALLIIEKSISERKYIALTNEIHYKISCNCEVCVSFQSFLSSKVETYWSVPNSQLDHVKRQVEFLGERLDLSKYGCLKDFNNEDGKCDQYRIMKNTVKNLHELRNIGLRFQLQNLNPEFNFSSLFEPSKCKESPILHYCYAKKRR